MLKLLALPVVAAAVFAAAAWLLGRADWRLVCFLTSAVTLAVVSVVVGVVLGDLAFAQSARPRLRAMYYCLGALLPAAFVLPLQELGVVATLTALVVAVIVLPEPREPSSNAG